MQAGEGSGKCAYPRKSSLRKIVINSLLRSSLKQSWTTLFQLWLVAEKIQVTREKTEQWIPCSIFLIKQDNMRQDWRRHGPKLTYKKTNVWGIVVEQGIELRKRYMEDKKNQGNMIKKKKWLLLAHKSMLCLARSWWCKKYDFHKKNPIWNSN